MMRAFMLTTGIWLSIGTVAFAVQDEIKIAIWMSVFASFALFVAVVEMKDL